MKYFRIAAKGFAVMFDCTFANTRNGFKHVCECSLYNTDGSEVKVNRVSAVSYYLNRTWEHWTFQTVCIKAIRILIENRRGALKREYKSAHNLQRMQGTKHKAEYENLCATDERLNALHAIESELKGCEPC